MKNLLVLLPLCIYMDVCGQNNDSAQFYFKKGLEEKTEKRYLIASQSFDKAVKYNTLYKEAILENAFTHVEMKKTDQAKALFTRVNELDPANKTAINELMQIYFNYRQFAKAIEFAKKCTGCENSMRISGMSYYEQEEYFEAETALKAALSKNPLDADVSYMLARTYLDMEHDRQAVPYYEAAIKLNTAKSAWMYELALLYYNLGDYKNAIAQFSNAANSGYVQSNDFNENFGYAALYSGDHEKGEKLLLTVLSKKPGNTEILRGLAEGLYKQKQFDRSLSYCQRLLELDIKDGKALYQAGLNFQKKGEKERGQRMCDKAIELDPSLADLRRKKEMAGM